MPMMQKNYTAEEFLSEKCRTVICVSTCGPRDKLVLWNDRSQPASTSHQATLVHDRGKSAYGSSSERLRVAARELWARHLCSHVRECCSMLGADASRWACTL
eukprot:jgi/Ulvmu1/6092/UM027_0070.1